MAFPLPSILVLQEFSAVADGDGQTRVGYYSALGDPCQKATSHFFIWYKVKWEVANTGSNPQRFLRHPI